jgi:galactosylceramidase
MRTRLPLLLGLAFACNATAAAPGTQRVRLDGEAGGKRFEGIGVVDGGGATSVLLKDYPEPQRSQILDLLYKPKFGASVSVLYVEIPGDGNSTQGSMPSHMHTRDDLNYQRGYTWGIMSEARKRNPALSLDGTAWSAPGWIGDSGKLLPAERGDKNDRRFFSQDTADYYIQWLKGLRGRYGLEMDALGMRNEKGVSYATIKAMRNALDANGFGKVRLHAFDNWPDAWKFEFVKDLEGDPALRDAVAIIGAHVNSDKSTVPASVREQADKLGKPLWNTEGHVYKAGYEGLIGIVKSFNDNYVRSGITRVVNWYGIAGLYTMEPYSGESRPRPRGRRRHFEPGAGCGVFPHHHARLAQGRVRRRPRTERLPLPLPRGFRGLRQRPPVGLPAALFRRHRRRLRAGRLPAAQGPVPAPGGTSAHHFLGAGLAALHHPRRRALGRL